MSATDTIKLYESLETKQANSRNRWQETADIISPRLNRIVTRTSPGQDRTQRIYDSTGIDDANDMTSGLSAAFMPSGQKFFGIIPKDKSLTENDIVQRYLGTATEIAHDEMLDSNFPLQINESLHSLGVFGTCNLFSEWNKKRVGLNYRDYSIGSYQMREGEDGQVDTMLVKREFTARQAVQKFGNKCGEKCLNAAQSPKTEDDIFEFIHHVAPREENVRAGRRVPSVNMPWFSKFVNVKEILEVSESGFNEFPFAAARWTKSSDEVFGRGPGTDALSKVKTLQQLWKDFTECANKHNNPAREVLASAFEGKWRVTPGAINLVQTLPSSRPIEAGSQGAFPITREILEFQQQSVGRTFYKDVFAPLGDLTGDRRTTVEIIERLKESLRKLALPVARVQQELFNSVIIRTILLLIDHGMIPQPPPELIGQGFGIVYEGQLAIALKNQQARGFQQFMVWLGAMEEIIPGSVDYIDAPGAIRRQGRSFGINEEDLATDDEVAEKKKGRAEAQQKLEAAQAAEVASSAYQKTSKAAEAGSPAEQLVGAL